jgi:ketosteroid isomerase-like protein
MFRALELTHLTTMKKALLLLSLLAIACTSNKQPDISQTNIEIATKIFEAFNQHDWKLMTSYYADTASFLDPSFGKDYVTQTHDQSIKKYNGLQAFAPDIHDSIASVHGAGDFVTVEFISTGTSNGQKWRLPICSILTIKNGKVVKDATYYDQ